MRASSLCYQLSMVAGQTGPRPLVLLRVAPARRLERVPTPPRVVAEANAAALASSSATRRLARAPMVMSIRACLLDSDFYVAIIDCQADYGVLPTTLLCSENSQGAIFRCDSQTICGACPVEVGVSCPSDFVAIRSKHCMAPAVCSRWTKPTPIATHTPSAVESPCALTPGGMQSSKTVARSLLCPPTLPPAPRTMRTGRLTSSFLPVFYTSLVRLSDSQLKRFSFDL
jgi:hypothetical protein